MIQRTIVLFLCAIGTAFAATPAREEFAFEAPITLDGRASVYRAPLTANVYQGVTRSDLGDMRVFNASGEVVPHGLTRPKAEAAKKTVALPLFPLGFSPDEPRSDVSLQVDVKKDGAIVNVKSSPSAKHGERTYLLDATQVRNALTALSFQWRSSGGDLHRITIETSEDLKNWRLLTQGILARLKRDGQMLERDRVEFPATRAKYLRVIPGDSSSRADMVLTRVVAELSMTVDQPRTWVVLTAQSTDKPEERRYVSGGKMPADRARIDLAPNSVARVTIQYRAKTGDDWQYAGQKTVYRLEASGAVIKDNEIRFGRGIVADQWLLEQNRASGNGMSQVTALELGWIPQELIFVARGDGPFVLAYGKNGLRPANDGVGELLRQSRRTDERRVPIGSATLGAARELQGERALRRRWNAGWKTWLLWTVLVLGVAMLAYLAWRIGKQFGRTNE